MDMKWVVAVSLGVTMWTGVRTAEACSPTPDLGLDPLLVDGTRAGVPTNGVIAFRATAYGDLEAALDLLAIEVVDTDDAVVTGTIESVELSSSPGGGSHAIYVVWRPSAPFTAGASLTARVSTVYDTVPEIEMPERTLVATLEITIGAGEAGALPVPEIGDLALAPASRPDGRAVCCALDCGDECRTERGVDHPLLTGAVALDDATIGAQVYVRLLAGTDGSADEPIDDLGLGDDLGSADASHIFASPAARYCFGAETVSLIDGSVAAATVACIEHGSLVLGQGDSPGFAEFVETCIEPYWEDTHEPYVPGGAGSEGASSSGDAGGGDVDADEDTADAKGCGCRSDAAGARGWLPLAVIGWFLARRRSARRSGRAPVR